MQASIAANTYVVSGPSESRKLEELLPGIITQVTTIARDEQLEAGAGLAACSTLSSCCLLLASFSSALTTWLI